MKSEEIEKRVFCWRGYAIFIPFHAPCTCSSIEAVNSWANDTRNCRKRNNCPKSAISFLLTIYSLSLSLGSQLQCPAGYLTSCNLAPEHLQCPATVVINSFADCDVEKMVILKIIFNLTVVILKIYKKKILKFTVEKIYVVVYRDRIGL